MAPNPSIRTRLLVLATAALAAVAVLVPVAISTRADVSVTGLPDGGAVTPAALQQLAITTSGDAHEVEVLLDGEPVSVRQDGGTLRLDLPKPEEGAHTLSAWAPGGGVQPGGGIVRAFTVDATPPKLTVEPVEAVKPKGTATIRGKVEGAAAVTAQGRAVPVKEDGTFSVSLKPGITNATIEARDAAGNTVTEEVPVPVRHPGMRAVHMTASAWASDELREPVMQMAREGRIDTVQLDIKDESGEIGYQSQVPLAKEIGATRDYYDAKAALRQLHDAGLRVVGRIVAFRDPILAEASWNSGHRERVMQHVDGGPWSGGYGEYPFTNFANPEVRAYNIAIAEEAAALGFDDILYDYVRRPDGDLSQMRIPGLKTSPERSIADFLKDTRPVVREHGALLGACVFGIAASRPKQIAQDIPMMSDYVDYVAPMVYPSHWGPGEYGVADPGAQPYEITARSLADFASLAEGGSMSIIPWLQAFSLQHHYGPEEVRAQIDAAKSVGIDSFLLWNASCRYDPAALDPVG
jgi:hypothetical protein